MIVCGMLDKKLLSTIPSKSMYLCFAQTFYNNERLQCLVDRMCFIVLIISLTNYYDILITRTLIRTGC